MNEIEFVYFKKAGRGGGNGRSVDGHHIYVYVSKPGAKSPSYRISTNKVVTKMIIDKGCEFCCIGKNNLTGQKYLVFNKDNENGFPISMPTGKNPSVIIYSKTMAEFIKNILNMKDDEASVWVSDDLSNTQDVVTLEIKRG
jgi:hypothetical protein